MAECRQGQLAICEATSFFPYALNLGLVMPLCLLSAYWLWRTTARR